MKNSTQGETAPELAEQKDNQRREEQKKIGEERNIEISNTFSVLQEEEKELIPEEDSTPIVKTDKNENKTTAGKGRGKLRKSLNETKGKGETTPKPGIQKNNSNDGTQTEKKANNMPKSKML